MLQSKDIDWLNGYKNKTHIYAAYREPQTPGNINWSEASWRSSSQHQDPALSNCLQNPVLDASGQKTSKTGIQHNPSKKNNEMTKKYVTDEGAK